MKRNNNHRPKKGYRTELEEEKVGRNLLKEINPPSEESPLIGTETNSEMDDDFDVKQIVAKSLASTYLFFILEIVFVLLIVSAVLCFSSKTTVYPYTLSENLNLSTNLSVQVNYNEKLASITAVPEYELVTVAPAAPNTAVLLIDCVSDIERSTRKSIQVGKTSRGIRHVVKSVFKRISYVLSLPVRALRSSFNGVMKMIRFLIVTPIAELAVSVIWLARNLLLHA
jgi:hypothetical protein